MDKYNNFLISIPNCVGMATSTGVGSKFHN